MPTLEQRVFRLEQGMASFGTKISALESCSGKKLAFKRHNITWFEPEGNPEIPLLDLLGEGCLEQKAIIFTVDATLYCEYYEDGWRVEWATHGGLDL